MHPKDSSEVDLQPTATSVLHWCVGMCVCARARAHSAVNLSLPSSSQIFSSHLPANILVENLFSRVLMLVIVNEKILFLKIFPFPFCEMTF